MSHEIQRLLDLGLISPPDWLPPRVSYLSVTGSHAYDIATDASDFDIYGFCVPPREKVFPHLAGFIPGFGNQPDRFEQYNRDHIACDDKIYDVTCFSIVKFFNLAMQNNPNVIDSLFVPDHCVIHKDKIGDMIREKRKLFLHKGSWFRFKGFTHSNLKKMSTKSQLGAKDKEDDSGSSHRPGGKRRALVETYGYDTKYASHVCRILLEADQILTEGDLDIQRNKEQLKAIRRGEWTEGQIRQWASDKERELEAAYEESDLRKEPDEPAIRQLLIDCLEESYGDLSCVISTTLQYESEKK